jgi:hypothetical protein
MTTMKERGTSHEALAKETGLAMGIVTKMRRDGRRPNTDAFLALCHWSKAEPMRFHIQQQQTPEKHRQKANPFSGLM